MFERASLDFKGHFLSSLFQGLLPISFLNSHLKNEMSLWGGGQKRAKKCHVLFDWQRRRKNYTQDNLLKRGFVIGRS